MHTTTSTLPFCHNTISTSTQTTIRQASHIENQRMCRSSDQVIGLTSCLHCTASTPCRWVHFSPRSTHILKWCFTFDLAPILDSFDFPTHDSSPFSINLPLSSASITPSLQPTSQRHPLCHFATIVGGFHRYSPDWLWFSRYCNASRSTKNYIPATEWLAPENAALLLDSFDPRFFPGSHSNTRLDTGINTD